MRKSAIPEVLSQSVRKRNQTTLGIPIFSSDKRRALPWRTRRPQIPSKADNSDAYHRLRREIGAAINSMDTFDIFGRVQNVLKTKPIFAKPNVTASVEHFAKNAGGNIELLPSGSRSDMSVSNRKQLSSCDGQVSTRIRKVAETEKRSGEGTEMLSAVPRKASSSANTTQLAPVFDIEQIAMQIEASQRVRRSGNLGKSTIGEAVARRMVELRQLQKSVLPDKPNTRPEDATRTSQSIRNDGNRGVQSGEEAIRVNAEDFANCALGRGGSVVSQCSALAEHGSSTNSQFECDSVNWNATVGDSAYQFPHSYEHADWETRVHNLAMQPVHEPRYALFDHDLGFVINADLPQFDFHLPIGTEIPLRQPAASDSLFAQSSATFNHRQESFAIEQAAIPGYLNGQTDGFAFANNAEMRRDSLLTTLAVDQSDTVSERSVDSRSSLADALKPRYRPFRLL